MFVAFMPRTVVLLGTFSSLATFSKTGSINSVLLISIMSKRIYFARIDATRVTLLS